MSARESASRGKFSTLVSPTHVASLGCRRYLLDRANLLLFLDRPHSAAGGQARAQLAKPRQCLLSLAEATDLMLTTGVSMDRYLVFCKLLRAGYIVQRHPARWLLRPGQDLAHAGAGLDRAPAAAASSADQQQQQQQVVSGTESSAPGSSTLPRAPGPKRRKVPAQPQRSRTWWYGSPQASALGQHTGEPAASPGSANPWLRCLPAEFVSSLPRCTVLPDAAQHARASFPHMAPLQALPLAELQPLTGPAGGQHLLVSARCATERTAAVPHAALVSCGPAATQHRQSRAHPPGRFACTAPVQHYDVFNSNSRFSRKTAGRPVFVVSVLPCTQLPTPHDLAAADMAADGVPVRFSTVENGDICFYGLSHVELAQLARS